MRKERLVSKGHQACLELLDSPIPSKDLLGDQAPLAPQDCGDYLARKAHLESRASQECQEKVYVCTDFCLPTRKGPLQHEDMSILPTILILTPFPGYPRQSPLFESHRSFHSFLNTPSFGPLFTLSPPHGQLPPLQLPTTSAHPSGLSQVPAPPEVPGLPPSWHTIFLITYWSCMSLILCKIVGT